MSTGTGCGLSSGLATYCGNREIRIDRMESVSMSVSGGVDGLESSKRVVV